MRKKNHFGLSAASQLPPLFKLSKRDSFSKLESDADIDRDVEKTKRKHTCETSNWNDKW